MTQRTFYQRHFLQADQVAFADLSGDWNPMHMDPLAARRTQVGAPVVHGIHMLLSSLDAAVSDAGLRSFTGLQVRFDKPVYVGDTLEAVLSQLGEDEARIDLLVDGETTSQIAISFRGARIPALVDLPDDPAPELPQAAVELTIEQMQGRAGRVAFASTAERVAQVFPEITSLMGADWVRSVIATTTLVGMVCPGLHSMYGALTVSTTPAEQPPGGLAFRVSRTDPRFRIVQMNISGPGLAGTIKSFARHAPTQQAALDDVTPLVAPDEFAGVTALVVGGSRGLGELSAKLLAAGGAHLIITYSTGLADAESLAQSIRSAGGTCDVMAYDVTKPAAPQLQALPSVPTQLYYFATPSIFRRKAGLFVAERFDEFRRFYVDAFYDLFMALRGGPDGRMTAFYPSSVAVEARPADMTEYAMAKSAGELLCADLQAFVPGARIVISRLPRLPTDQTATMTQTETADPVSVMLPIIRQMQS